MFKLDLSPWNIRFAIGAGIGAGAGILAGESFGGIGVGMMSATILGPALGAMVARGVPRT